MANKESKNENILVIGLGNPSEEFENTYHNIGLNFISRIAENLKQENDCQNCNWKKEKKFFWIKQGNIILIKPETFMNESGIAVLSALKIFKIKTENIIIIHDDSDIFIGDFKMSFDKASAGHKGVQSIIDLLKSKQIIRFRVGTRSKIEKNREKAGDFALKKIKKEDIKKIENVFEEIQKEIKIIASKKLFHN